MKPLLKSQDCLDHDPIEQWIPADPSEVDYWLCLHIGPPEGKGADLFYVNVLSEQVAESLPVEDFSRRKKIVVGNYSWAAVMASVGEILNVCEGPDWHSVADKLSEKFRWEFENYQPYVAPPSASKLLFKAFGLVTLIPIFSLILLTINHADMVTGTTTIYGFSGIILLFCNMFGLCAFGILTFPIYGNHPHPITLISWLLIIFLNWVALLILLYIARWSKNSANPLVKKMVKVLFWVYIIAMIFIVENKMWHLIESIKTWFHS